jgi:hypothetical protein
MNKKVFKKISIVALFTITFIMTVFPPAWELLNIIFREFMPCDLLPNNRSDVN